MAMLTARPKVFQLGVAKGAAGHRDPRVDLQPATGHGGNDRAVGAGQDVDGVLLTGQELLYQQLAVPGQAGPLPRVRHQHDVA